MNYLKYKSIFRGPGGVGVAGGNYTYGQTFVVPADQAQKLVSQTLLENRLIEFMGEVDENGMSVSANFINYREGIAGVVKRNYMPTTTFEMYVPDTAFDNADTMAVIGLQPKKKMTIDKIIAKAAVLPAVGDGAGTLDITNRVNTLVLKGEYGTQTQITTNAYMDNNGTLGSLGLPDSGTALDSLVANQDVVYLGFASKFSGVYVDMTASVNTGAGSSIASIQYWNGAEWVAFTDFDDLTARGIGVSLGGDGWIAWYEKPSDWSPYDAVASAGTVNSGGRLTKNTYWVAITWAAAFDADVEIERVWVPDVEPIANINFQTVIPETEASIVGFTGVVQKVGAVYSDLSTAVSPIAANWQWAAAANDAVYVGYRERVAGIVFDLGEKNAVVNAMTVSYWNGAEWVSTGATDGTDVAGASLGQDGLVSFTMPTDWRAATKTDILSTNAPAATPDESLFWLQVTISVQVTDATFDLNFVYPARSATIPIEVNVADNTVIMPHEKIHLYVGETEAQTDALSGVKLEFVGADI